MAQPPFDNFAAAKQAYNVDKNRYRDILPYDRTRVRLRAYEAQPGSDYINANFVPVRWILARPRQTYGDYWADYHIW